MLAGFFVVAEILIAVIRFPFENRRFAGAANTFPAQALNSGGFVIFDNLQNGHIIRDHKLAPGTRQHQGEGVAAFIFHGKLFKM